jgi:hypothetical protein
MKLDIETWLETQSVPLIASELVNEAVACYKAGAYRAALMFSYIGFMQILKERILAASKPDGITVPHWKGIQESLKNDEKWDKSLFDVIRCTTPAKLVFKITDDLRNQVLYWKDRRNDCAHSKSSLIAHHQVESFWSFMISNLPKLVVIGSKEEIISKIKIHYDLTLTPPNEDPFSIIDQIPHAVHDPDFDAFMEDIDKAFKKIGREEKTGFYNKLLDVKDPAKQKKVEEHLKANELLLMDILASHPVRVSILKGEKTLVRRVWHFHLNSLTSRNDLEIYCALLRNNLIPSKEISEANEHIVKTMRGYEPQIHYIETLRDNHFFDALENIAFDNYTIDDFDWANANVKMMAFHLKHNALSEKAVKAICNAYSGKPHPWTMASGLTTFFEENTDIKKSFVKIAKKLGGDLPKYISSLGA